MKTRVAVIYGGRSGEHEISIRSAKSIMAGLDSARYDIIEYFIDKAGKWTPRPIQPEPGAHPEIDVVFPVLHGTFGEDGTVQGLLELADLPYVGAAVLASSVSMDKEMMKRVCTERGLPVVEYVALTRARARTPGRTRNGLHIRCSSSRLTWDLRWELRKLTTALSSRRRCDWRPSTIARSWWSAAYRDGNSSAPYWAMTIRKRRSVRSSSVERVLRLRRQISARPGAVPAARRAGRGADGRTAPVGCGMLQGGGVRRHGARGFSAGVGDAASCTSTRSIPFPDSLRSACIRRCGSGAACRFPRCWIG